MKIRWLLKCPILIWTTLKNMFGPSLMRFQKLSQVLQKIIKNRSNTKMYVLPHGTKSILRLCSNDIFYQERIILCWIFWKNFLCVTQNTTSFPAHLYRRKTLQTNATRVNFCFRTVKMATMLWSTALIQILAANNQKSP